MANEKVKSIVVSVTNDLVTDQRVHKVCSSLQSFGYDVTLVGRKLTNSLELRDRGYHSKRFNLLFNKNFLFYASYNVRLFLFLILKRPGNVLSNDLDTLPANYLYSRLFNKNIFYDSHEYFTQVPELVNRNRVRKIWEWIEGRILPKLKKVYTVSNRVSQAYENKYGIKMEVVRNFPKLKRDIEVKSEKKLKESIIVYQGVLNIERGLEEAILAMHYINDALFLIVGGGDIEEDLKTLVLKEGLQNKVKFLGQLPFEKLPTITAKADVGLSIEKPIGLNYQMALPNKLFDYIHAEIPVIVSPLVEVNEILDKYDIGLKIDNHQPTEIAAKINQLLNDNENRAYRKEQIRLAKKEYCWENEELKLKKLFIS